MKKKFIHSTISFLEQYHDYSKNEIDRLRYGLEGIYLTFTKTIIILLIAFILGILKEVLILLVLFNIIRYTGFGFHAEKSYQCFILSTIYFICIPLFFMHVKLSFTITVIICSLCILSYFLFAPADTVKRPLPNKKKRIIRKFFTVVIGCIYSTLIFILPIDFFKPLLLSSLVIQSIVINPLLYKIFGQPYHNYKNYSKVLNAVGV